MANASADTPKEKDSMSLYSFCLSDTERKSDYQILIDNDDIILAQQDISIIIRNHFIKRLFRETPSKHLNGFLDFHYGLYQGDKQQFLRCIELDVKDFLKELVRPQSESVIVVDAPYNFGPYNLQEYKHYKNIRRFFDKWIISKNEGNEIVKKVIAPKKQPENIKLWRGDESSLEKLRELLIKHDFIDDIDKNQFFNHFTGENIGKPINWKSEQVALIRLLDKLWFAFTDKSLDKHVVRVENDKEARLPLPKILAKHFTVNGHWKTPKQFTQSRSDMKHISTKEESTINKIISEIKQYFPDT